MDMSIRFKADESTLKKLHERSEGLEMLPPAYETYYLPFCHGDIAGQILFGVIRVRDLGEETVELSCNRRNHRGTGYEHEKYVLFLGPRPKAEYLISALGLKEIGRIEQKTQCIRPIGFDSTIRFLEATATSGNKNLTTLKIEAQTEEGLLQGLQFLEVNPTAIEQVDPIVFLLA